MAVARVESVSVNVDTVALIAPLRAARITVVQMGTATRGHASANLVFLGKTVASSHAVLLNATGTESAVVEYASVKLLGVDMTALTVAVRT